MDPFQRHEYGRRTLDRGDLPEDPLILFAKWLQEAGEAGHPEPNAMGLATADASGRPDAREVLLKSFDARGFVFATNRESAKGGQIAANPHAALLFYWPESERQVRVRGPIERTSDAESDALFIARPLESRWAAIASRQSQAIASREALEERYREASKVDAIRPDHWGGFRVVPAEIEFWQGGRNRLHDRFLYRRAGDLWRVERLNP